MYKNQLQELAQRSCFNLPAYACIREGPDHAPRFKATVNFNGEIFESPTFYSTLRQAEHSAAEVALNTLAKRGPSKALAARVLDETGVYKNLLQETAHRAGLNLPVYTTIRSGPGHVPTFSCTVELSGMLFTGEPAKTKKQAQKNAAMAAWSTLKQMSQQDSSSSRPWGPGCHEEQEQVIVGRFLASLLPTESSNSPQNNHQIKQKRSPASTKSSLPSTPSQYCGQYQNCGSSILSPEMAMYYIWLQEQAAEQQSHVLALPVSPVPPPSQFFPLMHSIYRPSYHPYCLPQEQQTVNLRPGRGMTSTGPSLYFLNQSAPEYIRTRSMVTIQEIQEEKMEDSSQLPPPEVSKSSTLGTNGTEPVTNEQHQKFDTEKNCSLETTIGNGVIPERNQGGHLEGSSTSCLGPRIQPRDPHSTNSLGFGSPMYEHQPTHVQAAIYHGSGRMQPSNTPLINNSFSMPSPSMRTTHPSYLGRHQRPYRLPSRLMAPAVQIRSVVPVCSTPPPRKITGSRQEEQPGHEVKSRETELSPKLGNLHIKSV